jgi:hypothetical protein
MRTRLAIVALATLAAAQLVACSSGEQTSCADLAERIATLEAPSVSGDPSWDSILAMAERTDERDALRAQQIQRECK